MIEIIRYNALSVIGFVDHKFKTSATINNYDERPTEYPAPKDTSWNINYFSNKTNFPNLKTLIKYED